MNEEIKTEVMSWIKTIVLALVFALFITNVVIVNASVPSSSMEKNIMTGDRIVAFRLSYLFSEPERYDIVVFHYPDDESVLFVKRIIGMPGETVNIVDGEVYINDSTEPLDTSFVNGPLGDDNASYEVPEGHYFMMGDNRQVSQDSRRWDNKFVAEKKILGKVIFKYYKGIGLIK